MLARFKGLLIIILLVGASIFLFDFRSSNYYGSKRITAEFKGNKKGMAVVVGKNGFRVWATSNGRFTKKVFSTDKITDTIEKAKELKETSKGRADNIDAMNVN